MNLLKSNVEHILGRMRIPTRDENGEARSSENITEDVMAYLEQCTPEYAQQLLFEIELAKAIDSATGRVEKSYWG